MSNNWMDQDISMGGVVNKLFSFKGRIPRKEFFGILALEVLSFFILSIIPIINKLDIVGIIVLPIYGISIASLITRRLHDAGHSCVWLILGIIDILIEIPDFLKGSPNINMPLLYIMTIMLFLRSKEDNEYGPNPKISRW